MSSTNVYVDEHIAIEYSTEYETCFQPGYSYSFSRGNQMMTVDLPDRESWEWRKMSNSQPAVPNGPNAAIIEKRILPHQHGDYCGQAIWSETKREGKLLFLNVDLYLELKDRTFTIRISDRTHFDEAAVSSFLNDVSFPGQPAYEAAKASTNTEFDSPYAIELRWFPGFGPISESNHANSKKYNVTFDGEDVDEHGRKALNAFKNNERTIFEMVRDRVFRYYQSKELPALKGFVPDEFLLEAEGPEDFQQYLAFVGLHLHASRSDGSVPIGLTFDACWTENDVGVRVVGEKIEAVGTAYTALERE